MKMNKQKYDLVCARACMGFNDIVKAGIPKGTLCNAIRGKDVRPDKIGKIAKILNCDVTEIID